MGVSALNLDLNSEELRARRQEAIFAQLAIPVQPQPISAPVSSGLSTVSSIQKADGEKKSTPPALPSLEAPKHFMLGLIRAHGKLETVADKQTRLFEQLFAKDMAEIERLDLEKLEKLRNEAEALKSKNTWGALSSAAQYLMSGATIGLGILVTSSGVGAAAGGLMIASGVLGLAGRVMHDTGTFQAIASWFTKSNELQKKVASRIEMGMFTLSFGLGLNGGIWAHSLHAFSAINHATKIGRIAAGIGIGASIGSAGTRFGMSFAEKKINYMKADLQNIETKTNQIYQDIYQNCREVQNLVDSSTDIGDELKQAISASRVDSD